MNDNEKDLPCRDPLDNCPTEMNDALLARLVRCITRLRTREQDMTDAEISRRLALAIGWESDQMTEHMGSLYVADWPRKDTRKTVLHGGFFVPPLSPWDKFDYRDPTVIWPIAEAFDAFPRKSVDNPKGWASVTSEFWINDGEFSYADTAAKAVALAVIKAHEGSKT